MYPKRYIAFFKGGMGVVLHFKANESFALSIYCKSLRFNVLAPTL